jgi:protein-S-isoprenylcysteine O-methyltransferase Ste14
MSFSWIINTIVIIGVVYLSFAMALAGWIAGLKRGEAVTLVKTKAGSQHNFLMQIGLVVFALIIAGLLIYWLWIPLPFNPSKESKPIFMAIGLVAFIAGTLFTLWARRTLGRMWGISTSREVKLLPDHQLIDQGPYALVRHPMYFGWWMAMLGLLLIYWTWVIAAFLAFSLVAFYKRARREESVLEERFGERWQSYKKHTKLFIPWIY